MNKNPKNKIRVFDRTDVTCAGEELDHGFLTVPDIQIDEARGVVGVPFGGTFEKRYWGPIEVGLYCVSPYPDWGIALVTGVFDAEVREPEGTGGPGQMDSDCIDYSRSTLAIRAWPDPDVRMQVSDDFQLIVIKAADEVQFGVRTAE